MVVLKVENIIKNDDKFPVTTLCLCQAYSRQPTKTGGSFIGGTLSFSDGTLSFKSWSSTRAYESLLGTDLSGKIVEVTAEVNVYQGSKSLIVQAIKEVDSDTLDSVGLKISDFMCSKYNQGAYWDAFLTLLKKNLSEKAWSVLNTIIGDENIKERFCNEFAALFYHDNCMGGLLAHTLKVTQMASLVKRYPNIAKKVSTDLLYFGCAIHDIGKIREYSNGAISKEGIWISHNVSGILVLEKYSDLIKSNLGEDFYIGLCSVISGHHGEAGEPPRTVAAYVVHLLDHLESRLTSLDEMLATSEDGRIVYEGFKLS